MKSFGLINIGVLPLLLEAMVPLYGQHEQRNQESKRPNQEQEARPEGREARPRRDQEERQRPQEARPERPPQQATRPEGLEARPQRGQEDRQRAQEARPERQPPPPRPANQEPQQRVRVPQEHERQPDARGRQEQQRQRQAPRPLPQQQAREREHRTVWHEHRAENWQSQHRTWQDRGGYQGYRIPEARYRGTFGPGHRFRMYSYPLIVVGGYPRFQFGGFWFSVMDPWPEYWSDDWYGDDDMYVDYYSGGYYLRNRRHPQDRIAITVSIN